MKVLTGDSSKCTLARACESACARANHKKEGVAYSAIRVTGAEGQASFNVCSQCGECIAICPAGALFRNKIGTVRIRKEKCVACYMCIGFCPTLSMFRADDELPPFKCISCGQCAKACPQGAVELATQPHEGLPA
jgi:anaerobic carbon-monoxide dehydrogenase iron sulfur subunit